MRFGECDECGALVWAEDEDNVAWGSREAHEQWHRKLAMILHALNSIAQQETTKENRT
jgi:hypothetical protein